MAKACARGGSVWHWLVLGFLAWGGPAAAEERIEARAARVSYNRDIRPILAEKCFKCHGPDARERKAKLRLDAAEFAYQPAASGEKAIVPGKLEESALVERITSADSNDRMPPAQTGKTLSPAEVDRLRRWISQGAKYEAHWAFIPPARPEVPLTRNRGWARNAIDAFVLAQLEAEALAPAPEADRTTLVRRLSLDLIGLPPTVAEVDAFLADTQPGAYERVVERLLASPRYGERWGRLWLDAARYADSDGYEKDKPRQVSLYREWVIKALNRDLPYDQFILDQVAGDMLPGAGQDERVATGFLRNSMINEEGGIDPEQFRMEAMFDRMDCVGKAVLGLTIQCTQCHDHKYDPLKQEEYYRMFACLNNAHEATIAAYSPFEEERRRAVLRGVKAIESELKAKHPDWPAKLAEWEKRVTRAQPRWEILRPEVEQESSGGEKYQAMADGSLLAGGYAPTKHTLVLHGETKLERVTAVRLELLTDPNLPRGGPGRSIKGTAALTEIRIAAEPLAGKGSRQGVKIVRATADVNPAEAPLDRIHDDRSNRKRTTGPVAFAIDGKDETAWGIDIDPGRRNQPRQAVFELERPVEFKGGVRLTIELVQNHGGWNSDDNQNINLGRFRLAATDRAGVAADPVSHEARGALAKPAGKRTAAEQAAIFTAFRESVAEWKDASARIDALWRTYPEGTNQFVLEERETRRPTSILARGDFLKPVRVVEPGVPAFLNPGGESRSDRLAFARWLVDRKAPTTARSIVNRVWQAYFGVGIVATSEDLGLQCEPPSHPELLDWLAVELMDRGYSLKAIQRLIVSSAVYRQSSRATRESIERDPYNRLLGRGARFRMDAELVRDAALASSGLLDQRIGGPSAYPAAPGFLFQPPASYGPKVWNEAVGPDRYRRALYTFRYRSVPYPMLQAFDAPNGDFACVRRARSNTPLQALATLNEPISLECARALALRVLSEARDDHARVTLAYRLCVARPPSDPEARLIVDLLERETRRYAAGALDPKALVGPMLAGFDTLGVKPGRAAAWTVAARVILNLDETISRE